MPHAKNVVVVLAVVVVFVLLVAGRGRVRILEAENRRSETQGPAGPPGPSAITPGTTVSLARLSKAGTPDNCADVTFEVGKQLDLERLRGRGFVVLKATCAESFPRLGALASCTRSDLEGDARPPTHAVAYYYDLATLEGDDTYRGQCLGTGGDWKIKPPGDPEYVAARARLAGATPHHEIDSLMELMP